MRRMVWLACAAAVFGGLDRAQASPLRLELWGSAHNFRIPYYENNLVINVGDDFSGYTGTGGGSPLQHQWEAEGWTRPINDMIYMGAALFDGDRYLGQSIFFGPITGSITYQGGAGRFGASAHGLAVGELNVASGVDPSELPSWFKGMTLTADSFVGGGRINGFYTTITIAPAPVPEPSSAIVFLAIAGLVVGRRLRRA